MDWLDFDVVLLFFLFFFCLGSNLEVLRLWGTWWKEKPVGDLGILYMVASEDFSHQTLCRYSFNWWIYDHNKKTVICLFFPSFFILDKGQMPSDHLFLHPLGHINNFSCPFIILLKEANATASLMKTMKAYYYGFDCNYLAPFFSLPIISFGLYFNMASPVLFLWFLIVVC